MLKSLERFLELYQRQKRPYVVLGDNIWVLYQRMVVPVGPIQHNYSITKEEARILLSKFKFEESILVRYSTGFIDHYSEWYAVVCDKFVALEELPSQNNRSKIRRGLKNCIVRRVDADFMTRYGYDLVSSAFKRYKDVQGPEIGEKEFKKTVSATKGFEDIVHYWGVFHGNEFIAYSINFIFDKIEANYNEIRFDPSFLKLYPSYALIYTMNKYYLKDMSYEYVNDGFRSLLHQTNVQDFLMDKFQFKRAYTNINVMYRPFVFLCLSLTFPLRKILSKVSSKLGALYKLEEIRKNCNEKVNVDGKL